jgi:hypothetical protein
LLQWHQRAGTPFANFHGEMHRLVYLDRSNSREVDSIFETTMVEKTSLETKRLSGGTAFWL